MRVVLDTNILISACWKPGGLEERAVEQGIAGRYELVASPQLWAEYEEVLGRRKFAKLADRVELLLRELKPRLHWVEPQQQILLARDPDDNLVLECAASSGAAYLVTGNLKDYPLDWPVARIVNARQFFDAIGPG